MVVTALIRSAAFGGFGGRTSWGESVLKEGAEAKEGGRL
jgi:hypothetical protein